MTRRTLRTGNRRRRRKVEDAAHWSALTRRCTVTLRAIDGEWQVDVEPVDIRRDMREVTLYAYGDPVVRMPEQHRRFLSNLAEEGEVNILVLPDELFKLVRDADGWPKVYRGEPFEGPLPPREFDESAKAFLTNLPPGSEMGRPRHEGGFEAQKGETMRPSDTDTGAASGGTPQEEANPNVDTNGAADADPADTDATDTAPDGDDNEEAGGTD